MIPRPATSRLCRALIAAATLASLPGCLSGGDDGGGRGDVDAPRPLGDPTAPERAVCGDGRVQPSEICDWRAAGADRACAELAPRYVGGHARCTGECTLDVTGCELGGECGNGRVEPGEHCDDGNLDDRDGCSSACTTERLEGEGDDTPTRGGQPMADLPSGCTQARLAEMPAPAEVKSLRLQVHVVRKGDRGAASATEVAEWLEHANAQLGRAQIELLANPSIDYIDDAADGDQYNLTAARFDALVATNNDPDALDVYFVNTQTVEGGVSVGGRVAEIGGSAQVDGFTVTRGGAGATLAHEVGHVLGLYHTHQRPEAGWTSDACEGDGLCDTAADPGKNGEPSCADRSEAGGCDCSPGNSACDPACTDESRPDPRNVMSYYGCGDHEDHGGFTVQQVKRMHCVVNQRMDHARAGAPCTDRDGDGFGANPGDLCDRRGVDCDDRDPLVSPAGIEICNTRDDDCDGDVDEDTSEVRGADGQGACRACEAHCVEGEIQECAGVDPRPETCNGEDDDCDGRTDEGVDPLREAVADRCPSRGICEGARQICQDGAWRCELPVGYVAEECPVRSADRVCAHGALEDPTCSDGVDNDCDGVRDEHDPVLLCQDDPRIGQVGQACFAGAAGRCAAGGGVYRCVDLAEACGVGVDCVGATFPENERCDDQDWDCDGHTFDRADLDNDGYGDCDGRRDCDESRRDVHPGAPELCDRADNDCDGRVDEGFGTATCGRGVCQRTVQVCQGGAQQVCRPGQPQPEICNGLDDNCDGRVDEGDVCHAQIRIPAIHVTNLQVLSGDREFGGNGPLLTAEARVRGRRGQLTVQVCVDAHETGGRDSHGRRCVEQTHRVPFGEYVIEDEGASQLVASYVDSDHGWDDPKIEQHPQLHAHHGANVSARCLGDTRGDDLCADGNSCTGCIFTFQPVRVRAVY